MGCGNTVIGGSGGDGGVDYCSSLYNFLLAIPSVERHNTNFEENKKNI